MKQPNRVYLVRRRLPNQPDSLNCTVKANTYRLAVERACRDSDFVGTHAGTSHYFFAIEVAELNDTDVIGKIPLWRFQKYNASLVTRPTMVRKSTS